MKQQHFSHAPIVPRGGDKVSGCPGRILDAMTDDADDDFLDTQWTDEAKTRFVGASRELIAAIEKHVETVTDPTQRRPGDWEPGELLRKAAVAYADAQLDYSGSFDPFGSLNEWDDEDEDDSDDEDEDESAEPIPIVSILYRADFGVTDESEVEAAGQAALQKLDPERGEVTLGLGGAIYQLVHVDGIESLNRAPGLMPLGAVTQVIDPADELEFDDMNFNFTEPNAGFSVGGEVLFTSEDRWAI
jgi:hypothetical protein